MSLALPEPTLARGCDGGSARSGGPLPPRIVLVTRTHPLRGATEACVASVFRAAYGARGLSFPPLLVAQIDAADRPLCAAGVRTAADGFFSEAYLDRPIERLLAERLGRPVARDAVLEVTQLASRSAERSSAFVRRIVALGRLAGFELAFFTATARLRRLVARLGIPLIDLGPADPARLADAGRWGSYYAAAPRVCAVDGRALAPSARAAGEPPADA